MSHRYSILLLIFCFLNTAYLLKAQGGKWMWLNGDSSGTYNYGTKGVLSKTNQPPSRYECAYWMDLNGNLWIFGSFNLLNDLWEFDMKKKEWVWVNGPKLYTHPGAVYGVKGVPSKLNYPPGDGTGNCWTDTAGDLWLYSAYGYDSSGSPSYLNDLWRYNIPSNEWTWMGGNKGPGKAKYNKRMSYAPGNWPPGVSETKSAWTDDNNCLWMFGGEYDLFQNNDMWKYSISKNEWAYMKGDSSAKGLRGHYGTLNVEDSANLPRARWSYVRWKDCDDNFYICTGDQSPNDVWRFNPKTNNWTLIWGDSASSYNNGNYISQCGTGSYPYARFENTSPAFVTRGSVMWNFGGYGDYALNDLSYFNINTRTWTWVSGTNSSTDNGHYGIKNVASVFNRPTRRCGSAIWTDADNNLWVFGGDNTVHNELWEFIPDTACVHIPPCTAAYPINKPFDTVICKGQSINLSYLGYYFNSVSPSTTVTNHTSSSTLTFSPLVTTSYTLRYETGSSKITVHFTLHVLQPDTLINDTGICLGSALILPDGNTVNTAGIYSTTFTNQAGCDSVIITKVFNKLLSYFKNWDTICTNNIFILPKGVKVSTAGIYIDTLVNKIGCDSIIYNSLYVNLLSYDTVSANICLGQKYILPAGKPVTESGIYIDTLLNVKGCDSIISTTLKVWPIPTADFDLSSKRVLIDVSPEISIKNNSINFYNLYWTLNGMGYYHNADTTINIYNPGNYCIMLRAYNYAGCYDSATHCFTAADTTFIAVPAAFTPNGDGNNDVFYPITRGDMHIIEFKVYNRWGQLLYDKPVRGWDGTYNGKPQPQDTYIYIVVAEDLLNPNAPKKITQKGDVELIR